MRLTKQAAQMAAKTRVTENQRMVKPANLLSLRVFKIFATEGAKIKKIARGAMYSRNQFRAGEMIWSATLRIKGEYFAPKIPAINAGIINQEVYVE